MTIVPLWTKRKIVDIKKDENAIDFIYMKRLDTMQDRADLVGILKDYEEFLPEGLQRFQGVNEEEFNQLKGRFVEFFRALSAREPLPSEPTEEFIFLQPPLLVQPRILAQSLTHDCEGKHQWTWGEAFL